MTRAVLLALLSHWRRNLLQLLTLVLGLAMATALWSGVQAINAEARASYDAAAATLGEGRFDTLERRDGQPMDQATYVALRRAGWLVSPVVEGRLNGIRIVGLDPLTAPGGLGPVTLDGGAELGPFLSGRGQVFGTRATLDAVGDIAAEKVTSPDVAPGTLLTDVGIAQRLLDQPGRISRLLVAPSQPLGQPALSRIAPDLARRAAQGGSDVGRLTDSFHLNLTAFGLLSFAVGLFIVNGAIGLAFEQRRATIRTLRALGVSLARLLIVIAAELALLALASGAIGVALGYVIAASLLPDVAATLRGLYGADVGGTLSLRPAWWLSGLVIALAGTALAAAGAFWRLWRLPLLAGGQRRAQVMAAGAMQRWQALGAVALLALAALLSQIADGVASGFAFLGALLMGGSLALPPLLDRIIRFAESRARSIRATWFWADTRQQLPALSLALMALLLAATANIGVSTMVSSFRLTFIGFLDQRLASELYVTANDATEAEQLTTYLAPRVRAILPIQSAPIEVAGWPTEVFGARDDATYRDNWRFLQSADAPWDRLAAGKAILVNEQLARRAALSIGDSVTVAGEAFEIAGIYGDYGNPIGQAILTETAFNRLYPDVTALRFGLRLPAEDVPALVGSLETDLGLSVSQTINQSAIKAFSLGVFERTFTVTGALNVLTLAVAGFAILMSLLTLAAMRVPQLAPAWAMGLTRASLGRTEVLRAVMLAALTVLLALPLGLALAWALLAVVNVAAFGWQLPMFLFPLDYLQLGLLAVVAAVLAALWPAWRLSRTPPAELLKVFSNER